MDRWTKISELAAAAAELEPGARDDFLGQRCPPELRSEVESLLAHAGPTEGPLERLAFPAAAPSLSGARLGPYRVLGEIGQGGMGVVYRATREDGQFDREVAIKLISGGVQSRIVLERFRNERRILAGLDHPNIARLLDAGATEGGLPYLVLEYVDGVPLQEHAEKLTLHDRVRLIRGICAAVHFAHQRLVIHRDLKPANILVTAEGVPKLLDFGIGKFLSPEVDAALTLPGLQALTLAYASPEQVRGEPASTATDIYALGVILYEVLSGKRPYDVLHLTLSESTAVICERQPPLPSVASGIAELKGDLDSVISKAMAKDPSDRYGSAEDLGRDLDSFLNGRPVSAQPPAHWYLVRKFVARHRAAVAASAASVAILIIALAMALGQRQVADRERQRAIQRFQDVRKLANSVLSEFHDQAAKIPGSLELRKLMVSRSLEYLDSLARDSAGDPGLERELAMAYQRLGDIQGNNAVANFGDQQAARASYDRARQILERLWARDPSSAEAGGRLGKLLLTIPSGSAEDQELLLRARSLWEELHGRFGPTDEVIRGLGSTYFRLAGREKNPVGKKGHYQKALEAFGKLLAAKPDDADRVRNVALCHKYMAGLGGPEELPHLIEAERLDSRRVALTPSDPQAQLDLSFDLSMLGTHHWKLKDYAKATRYFRQVVDIRQQLWRAEPKDVRARERLAFAEVELGRLYRLSGNRQEARSVMRTAAGHAEELVRASPGNRTRNLILARALSTLGRLDRGQTGCSYQRRARVLFEKLHMDRPLEPSDAADLRTIATPTSGCP